MVYSTDLICWWVKKHTGDDNNKHLIHFLVCIGCTCVSVFVELCSQEAIFFCFGFTLFQFPLDLAFECVSVWLVVRYVRSGPTSNWSYIVYTWDKKVQMRGLMKWKGNLATILHSIVYFDFTLALSSSSSYFFFACTTTFVCCFFFYIWWCELKGLSTYIIPTHKQTGGVKPEVWGREGYNTMCSFWVLPSSLLLTTSPLLAFLRFSPRI